MIIKKFSETPSETKYLIISDEKEYFVTFKTKPGRTEIYCDCENGTKYCNSPTICKHKELAIVKRFNDRIKNED